jgi:glutaredoxin
MLIIGLAIAFSLSFSTVNAAENKVHKNTQLPRVELYVTNWCPYCKQAKNFLDQRGIEYRVYDIEHDDAAARRKRQLDPGRGVPFAVINGVKISGWSQQAYQAALKN